MSIKSSPKLCKIGTIQKGPLGNNVLVIFIIVDLKCKDQNFVRIVDQKLVDIGKDLKRVSFPQKTMTVTKDKAIIATANI